MHRRDFLKTGSALLGASVSGLAAPAQGASGTQTSSPGLSKTGHAGEDRFALSTDDVIFIFADLHAGLVNTSQTLAPDALAANARGLAQAARAVKAPMIFLTVPQNGKPGLPLPEIAQYADVNNTFFRVIADPFLVTPIVDALAGLKRKTLIISGYTAEVAVLLTALGALRRGYNVFIPVDCIGSRALRTEAAALHQAEQAGAVLTSLSTLAAQLAPDFSREPGKTILSVIANARS